MAGYVYKLHRPDPIGILGIITDKENPTEDDEIFCFWWPGYEDYYNEGFEVNGFQLNEVFDSTTDKLVYVGKIEDDETIEKWFLTHCFEDLL